MTATELGDRFCGPCPNICQGCATFGPILYHIRSINNFDGMLTISCYCPICTDLHAGIFDECKICGYDSPQRYHLAAGHNDPFSCGEYTDWGFPVQGYGNYGGHSTVVYINTLILTAVSDPPNSITKTAFAYGAVTWTTCP
jgi:hypothetical protein